MKRLRRRRYGKFSMKQCQSTTKKLHCRSAQRPPGCVSVFLAVPVACLVELVMRVPLAWHRRSERGFVLLTCNKSSSLPLDVGASDRFSLQSFLGENSSKCSTCTPSCAVRTGASPELEGTLHSRTGVEAYSTYSRKCCWNAYPVPQKLIDLCNKINVCATIA